MAEGLIYHMTPTNKKLIYAWVSTSHFVKGTKFTLRKNLLSILAPQRRNCRWCEEFMIYYDGYGLCCA